VVNRVPRLNDELTRGEARVSSATRAREKKAAIAIYYRAREEDKNRAEPLESTEFRELRPSTRTLQ
jgi:hypothetical protein